MDAVDIIGARTTYIHSIKTRNEHGLKRQYWRVVYCLNEIRVATGGIYCKHSGVREIRDRNLKLPYISGLILV